LVSDLGQLVGTKVMVQDGGQFNVYMGNGQALVLGDQATRLAAVSSAGDPGRIAVATVNAAGKTVEMQESMISGGSLGGLLQFRSETLAPAQNALGRMALSLADTFNAQQKLGMDLNGAMGTDFFSQATPGVIPNGKNTGGGTLVPRFSDSSQLTTSDYRVNVTGASSFTVTRLSDNTVVKPDSTTGAYDGVTLTLGGTAVAGDSFLLQPTRTGARDLTVRISDPAKVAAASPIITGNTAGNQGSGAITAGTVEAPYGSPAELASTGVTLTYDSATNELSGLSGGPLIYKPGEPIRFNGITVTISGTPANNDTFTIEKNTGGVSDGGNSLLLGALQKKKTLDDGTASVSDAYRQLVSTVGNKARQVQIANTAQASVTTQIRSAQQSVSGVNQDEETANLLMFQQMYQANAKVIQTASTLFDTVLGISR
jgi:flagellar hook-associated protein 1 FlgK